MICHVIEFLFHVNGVEESCDLTKIYKPNGLTLIIHKQNHQIDRDVGGRWENDHRKILLKNFKQRSSKLKKGQENMTN